MEVVRGRTWERPQLAPGALDRVFFEAAARGELLYQRCPACDHRQGELPYAVAMVELEEGVRMMGTVTGCPVESVRIGMPVESYAVECGDGMAVPFWRPADVA